MAAQDILLDDNWDLLTSNGDFVVGNSNEQHIALIVTTAPGHWKENPFLGFNAALYLGSNVSVPEMKANLIEQLSSDNAVLTQFNAANGDIINLNAERVID